MSTDYRNDNTIIFTIARMNPPTPGHLLLIESVIQAGIEKNVETVYIILSKTKDNDENPITCNEKINILGANKDVVDSMVHKLKEKMKAENTDEIIKQIDDINVVCLCVPDVDRATPFTSIGELISNKQNVLDIHLFLIIGKDREGLIRTVEKVFTNKEKYPNVKSVDGKILDREDMEYYKNLSLDELKNIDISKIPLGAFSASFVRKLVKYGLKDKFYDVYSQHLEKSKIEVLYDSISKELSSDITKEKNSKKQLSPTIENFRHKRQRHSSGGKKTNRRKKTNLRKQKSRKKH